MLPCFFKIVTCYHQVPWTSTTIFAESNSHDKVPEMSCGKQEVRWGCLLATSHRYFCCARLGFLTTFLQSCCVVIVIQPLNQFVFQKWRHCLEAEAAPNLQSWQNCSRQLSKLFSSWSLKLSGPLHRQLRYWLLSLLLAPAVRQTPPHPVPYNKEHDQGHRQVLLTLCFIRLWLTGWPQSCAHEHPAVSRTLSADCSSACLCLPVARQKAANCGTWTA